MTDLRFSARATIKIGEICATAERDVLAIVDVAAIGKSVGGGAAAEIRAFLKEPNAEAGISESQGGRQARQSAADHVHGFAGHASPQATPGAPARESKLF